MANKVLFRERFGVEYRWVMTSGIKVKSLIFNDNYKRYAFCGSDGGYLIYHYSHFDIKAYLLARSDYEVIKIDDGSDNEYGEKIVYVDCRSWDFDDKVRSKRDTVRIRRRVREAEEFLVTPLAREWLRKMQYTVRKDEYGHKFLFLAILCGYKKMDDCYFQKLCDSLSYVNFNSRLDMRMWIGGKVNWTMFYERPDHVNGKETYFCGVVGKDNFSPEDFDKDHREYSFANAKQYHHYYY